jgi:hypothetical protein
MRYLIVLILVLASPILIAQTTRVADNNFNAPTGPNVYSTIQAAVNASSPGDIIQVQPSPTTYGSVSINKPNLTLMGIGFNVDKDIPLSSNMGSITLTNNADNTSDSDGTVIRGLYIDNIFPGYKTGPTYVLENIIIENCNINYLRTVNNATYALIDGMEIRNNYFRGQYNAGLNIDADATNVIIRNNLILFGLRFVSTTPGSNIITNNILYDGIYINASGTTTTILNNNFMGASGTDNAFTTKLLDCIVANNIFYGMTPSLAPGGSTSTNFQRNSFTNNLVFSTGDDTMPPTGGGVGNSGTGNIISTPSFVNSQLLDTWSGSYDFTLQGGSLAINGGSDGSDIGITGGSYSWTDANFVLKTTAAPVIQILNTSTVINPGDDLPVRIKANSN